MPERIPPQHATPDHATSPRVASASQQSPLSWMGPVALVISLLAAAAGGWALFKPAPEASAASIFAGNPTAADPRAAACNAVILVTNGVARQSSTDLGPDPVALETVAANSRLAMAGGAAYLREQVPSNTPTELVEPIGALANLLQDIAQHFFVGETNAVPEQAARMAAAAESTRKLADLCK